MSNQQTFEIGEVAFHLIWKIEVTITSALRRTLLRVIETGEKTVADAYSVERSDNAVATLPRGMEIDPGRKFVGWVAEPRHLRKLRPPNELSSWDQGVWRPTTIKELT